MEKGSKFACSNCGSVLEVGEVEVTKRSLSDSGSQFQRKAGGDSAKKSPSSKRSGAKSSMKSTGAKSTGAKPSGATRRSRPAASGGAASKSKSSTPMILAGVGVVGVVIAIAVSMGGGDGGSMAGGVGGSGGGSGGQSGAAAWWEMTGPDVATMSAADLRASIREAKNSGFDENDAFWSPKADQLFKALLKLSPADKAANRHFGRVPLRSYEKFDTLWKAMDKHQARMPEKYVRFYGKYASGLEGKKQVYLSEEGYSKAAALLKDFAAWKKKMDADPSPQMIEKGLARIQARTQGYGVVTAVELPVIVYLGSKELDAKMDQSMRDAKTADLAGRVLTVKKRIRSVLSVWNEQVVKPLGLAPLPKDRAIYSFVFDNREKFDEVTKSGRGMSMDVQTPVLFSYRLSDSMSFGLMPATPEEDKWFSSDFGHVLVHQLHKAYSKNPKGKRWDRPFEEQNGLWFIEGLAEYLGAGARDGAPFSGISPKRAAFLKRMDEAGMPMFEMQDIVRIASVQRLGRFMRDSWVPDFRAEDGQPESATALLAEGNFGWQAFQAQCWYLIYFLGTYENGKYKTKLQDLTRTMLQGRQKPEQYGTGKFRSSEEAFAEIFGLKTDKDWERILKEYDDYMPTAIDAPK